MNINGVQAPYSPDYHLILLWYPFKVHRFLHQPFPPLKLSYLAINPETHCWQAGVPHMWLSQNASLCRPVDLYRASCYLCVHYSTIFKVQVGCQRNQWHCAMLITHYTYLCQPIFNLSLSLQPLLTITSGVVLAYFHQCGHSEEESHIQGIDCITFHWTLLSWS